MKINILYTDIMTMIYFSQLIYDYHKNLDFDLEINQTFKEYFLKLKTLYNDGIDNIKLIDIKEAILYLLKYYPNAKIYNYIYNFIYDIKTAIIIDNETNIIIITFKGTDSITYCYYDLQFCKRNIDFSNIEIHDGFFNQLMSIYDDIIESLDELFKINPLYNIYITGHSGGAGQSTILSYLLGKKYNNKIIKLITFGSPRVGNKEWKEAFNNTKNILYYRITNEGDIITSIPYINYYHVGINIHLTADNIYIGDDTICVHNNIINLLNIDNHKLINYINNFKNKFKRWCILFNINDTNNIINDELESDNMLFIRYCTAFSNENFNDDNIISDFNTNTNTNLMCNMLPIVTELNHNLCNITTDSDDYINSSDIIDTENIK